jgi:hypothetical protein
MSSIEKALARDIAAVTEGVVVTDSDLLDAQEAIDERVDDQRRRSRRRAIAGGLATAAAVAAIGVVAFQTIGDDAESAPPANSGPTSIDPYAHFLKGTLPTPALVDGMWRVDNGEISVMFGEDGTVQFDDRGAVVSDPATSGTYTIDGERIIVTASDSTPNCVGREFVFRAALPSPGSIRLAPSPDSANACWPVPFGQVVLEHLLPTSNEMAKLNNTSAPGWHPLPADVPLNGDWLAQGGGYILELAPDGSYVILGDNVQPTDSGEWSLKGSDLTLTSAADSRECNAGNLLTLSGLELVTPGTLSIRGSITQNDCGGNWTPDAWILVPNANPGQE